MKRFFRLCCLGFFLIAGTSSTIAQTQGPELDEAALEEYTQQCRQLVRFFQFVVNTLGDPKTSAREKDIIVNQSYLKIFRDAEVQIEDDLEEERSTVTNKDVQAYLKDIDFFFKQVRFDFQIEEITHELNEAGDIYFTIRLNRELAGTTVANRSMKTLQQRFMEVNLDLENRLLKIVSLYTTKLSEEDELAAWWNQLPMNWKNMFAEQIRVTESLSMADIIAIDAELGVGDTLFMSHPIGEGDSLRSDLEMLFSDSVEMQHDTIPLGQPATYAGIRNILRGQSLDLSAFPVLTDIAPVSQMTRLKRLNISGTQVEDLSPIRNLTKLEVLNCSEAPITSLAPLQYTTSLKSIIAHHTRLRDLKPLGAFKGLEALDVSYTPLEDISGLAGLTQLKELLLSSTRVFDISALGSVPGLEVIKLAGTPIVSLGALNNLKQLTVLDIGQSSISDLQPLSGLSSLELLFCDGTNVANLEPLQALGKLRKVYCDLTQVSRQEANRLMLANPSVLVFYESAFLRTWWDGVGTNWQAVLMEAMGWTEVPDNEELHGIVNLTALNLENQLDITSLEPLQQLTQITVLNCANSGVEDLSGLRDLLSLTELNVAGTLITDLSPIAQLRNLSRLDVSRTGVFSLEAIGNLNKLQSLSIEGTQIRDLMILAGLSQLETLYADECGLGWEEVNPLLDQKPDLQLVFRTKELRDWWTGVGEEWKKHFGQMETLSDTPTTEELHRLTVATLIEVEGQEIATLTALTPFARLKQARFSNTTISDLLPLQALVRLEELELSRSPVTNLLPLIALKELRVLQIPNTPVEELATVGLMIQLEQLNISGTPTKNLKDIATLKELKRLDCSTTDVNNLKYLDDLNAMIQLVCYNTRLNEKKVADFKETHPQCEVVFY